jgi:hypothetical protein
MAIRWRLDGNFNRDRKNAIKKQDKSLHVLVECAVEVGMPQATSFGRHLILRSPFAFVDF